MKRILLLLVSCTMMLPVFGQTASNFWQEQRESELSQRTRNLERVIIPNAYKVFSLDLEGLVAGIDAAPNRISNNAKTSNIVAQFPDENGNIENYRIQKTEVMHPDLAAKYPNIQSYFGQSLSNPLNKIYFTITSKGFRGLITGQRVIYIDPYAKGDMDNYIVYHRSNYSRNPDDEWRCYADDVENDIVEEIDISEIERNIQDGVLRRYDLAVACTSEYTAYHDDGNAGNGDARADALAAMVITVARINSVFERDFATTFQLVASNDRLIYANGENIDIPADPEPYDNYDGSQMLSVNTGNINGLIGFGAYSIGHVFSTGGGGIAGASPCVENFQGRGVTGIVTPEFDPFDIDYVAHEIGHQFGAGHTYYNACFGSKVSDDYEPGSASTIMGYAGICAPNVQDNSDGYFHARSIVQMSASILSDNCETEIVITNGAPTASAGPNYTIPISTPFILDGSASTDPNGDTLTYGWEQYDSDGSYTQPPLSTNAGGPVFRTLFPVTDPTRTFPNLEAVINNETPTWEVLPSVARQLDFRLTVRDNNAAGGQTDQDDTVITVSGTAGPFLVSYPNAGTEIWYEGATETITWSVNSTATLSPNVNILLSTDGGYTYPITLASNVPNDGSQDITVPDNVGTTNRIKIEAASNIFFDLSNQDFEIKAGTFEITSAQPTVSICQPTDAIFNLDFASAPGFSENIALTATGVPSGATVNFSPSTVSGAGSFTMTVSNTGSANIGNYSITIQGEGQTTFATETYDVLLNIFDNTIGDVTLTSPMNGATNQTSNPLLTWEALSSASQYDVEVSTTPDFASIAESMTVINDTEYQTTNLLPGTVYYWRVRPENTCLAGSFGEIFVFQTANDVCITYDNEYFENGDNIWNTGSNNAVSARVDVPDDIVVSDVTFYMNATHSDVGDIKMQFSSPTGIFAEVYNRECSFGSNFDVTFTDAGSALSCSGTPRVSGNVLPGQAFTRFDGTNGQGTWVLLATDRESDSQGGTFNEFSVTICGELQIVNDIVIVNNTGITLDQGTSTTINISELSVSQSGATDTDLNYTVTQLPQNGTLFLNGVAISIGGEFSQTDIDNNLLTYTNSGANSDSFKFSVQGNSSAILGGQQFDFIVNTPAPTGDSPQEFCSSSSPTLNEVVVVGDNIIWYDAATLGNVLPLSTVLADNTSYYASQTVGGNESTSRLEVLVSLLANDDASFAYSAPAYCVSASDPTPTITGIAGGTFTSTPSGLSINSSTGEIDISASSVGEYTVTYTTTGTCPNSSNQFVNINALDNASFNYSSPSYCVDSEDPIPTITGVSGGTFTSTPTGLSIASATGIIDLDASTPGTYTVTYTTGGCSNSSDTSVTINGLDDAGFSYSAPSYCANDSDPSPTITGLAGGTFTSAPAGLSINETTGVIDLDISAAGTYSVTYTTAGSCPNNSNVSVTINGLDDSSFIYNAFSYCQNDSDPTPTIFGLTGGTFSSAPTGLSLNASTGEIDLSASTPGIYTVTYTTAGTCPTSNDRSVSVNALDDASFSYSAAAYCSNDTDPTPTITGLGGGSFSSTAGLSINTSTGAIDVSVSTPGTYTVTYTTAGACPNSSGESVTLNGTPSAPTGSSPQMFNQVDNPTFADIVVVGDNIQWYDAITNGNTIDMSTALTDGTYYASQTINGCESDRLTVEVLINTLGNDDVESFKFSIYPNPTEGNFTIQFGQNISKAKVQLLDIRGRIIYSKEYDSNSSAIEVTTSNLNNGFYLVRITTDLSIVDKKLIIKN